MRTAIQMAEEQLNRHKDAAGSIAVTLDTFPDLHEAFEIISHDSGAGAGHETYYVPQPWAENLIGYAITAKAIRETLDDFSDFCIGEHSEVQAIAEATEGGVALNEFLNAFFDDWELTIEETPE